MRSLPPARHIMPIILSVRLDKSVIGHSREVTFSSYLCVTASKQPSDWLSALPLSVRQKPSIYPCEIGPQMDDGWMDGSIDCLTV